MGKRKSAQRAEPSAPPVVVDVVDGDGMIEMVGDDVASLLLLAGDPALVQGDTASYSWLFGRAGTQGSAEIRSLVPWRASAELDAVVRPGHLDPSAPDLLRPLLGLLRSGRYLMTVLAPRDVYRVGFGGPGAHVWYFDPYLGAAEDIGLVATDGWPPRDSSRVAHYREVIARGGRPAVVALFPPDGFVGYVLDGHHKLAAYGPARVSPLVIAVAPVRPFRPRNEDVRQALPAFIDAVPEPHRHQTIGLFDHLRRLSLAMKSAADESA